MSTALSYGKVPFFSRPIHRLVLGSIPLKPEEPEAAFAIMDAYCELGGNAIDCAHCYGSPRHQLIGRYLADRGRDKLIIMGKGCHPYDGRNRVTREDMFNDVDETLSDMAIESMEFFSLHRDDPTVPAGEVIEWLNELKQVGKIQAFGGSNWTHERIAEANKYADDHGLQPFSLSSPNLSLAAPQAEMWAGVVWLDRVARDWYEETRCPVFSWSSGGGGFFAGVESDDVKRVYFSEGNFARKARVEKLAAEKGLSPQLIAFAWTLNQPMNVFALMGPANPSEVRENMPVAEVILTAEELRWLEFGD